MNIFALNADPKIAAQQQCDKHVVKMVTESTQLLCTALRCHNIQISGMYKSFNPKHPSCLWASQTSENFKWLCSHALALSDEYTKRYNKIHKCKSLIELCSTQVIDTGPLTKFRMAMPTQFQTDDPVHSYKIYYAAAKYRFAKWKTTQPDWWQEYRDYVIKNNLEIQNDKDDYVKL